MERLMNEIAVSVSRLPDTLRLRLPVFGVNGQLILLCGLCAVSLLLLAVPAGRNGDQLPVQASAQAPTRVVRVLVAPTGGGSPYSASEMAREAAARSAILRPATDAARDRNRFEPETAVDDRRQVAVVCEAAHRGFDGPMWRFLLNEPVQPDIDLSRNKTYYGVKVSLPFGG